MALDTIKKPLRVVHTSDWHIGRALYGRKRYDEHEHFLCWLAEYIEGHGVDVLLVAGDVFDNTTPSNRAQELYYRFLCRVADSACGHVVVTAGNHDSPTFLDAPRSVLRHLNVHVVGQAAARPEDEVLALRDAAGAVRLIVCAVPYLRERDLRLSEAGETREEKDRKLIAGIHDHYRQACDAAVRLRDRCDASPPIIAMGHLFAAGGTVSEGDGVREIYIGSLARVGVDAFPACIDYLALGHLHASQCVGGNETRRYSGAPLPMSFGEARQTKTVLSVEFDNATPRCVPVPVPCFQALEQITGALDVIGARLDALKAGGESVWLEIVYEGDAIPGELRAELDARVADSALEILRVKNNRITGTAVMSDAASEALSALDVHEVFRRCLEAHDVPADQRPDLTDAYRELVVACAESDARAE